MTGERIPHPDDYTEREAYDLLALASGPWTEARLRTAPPKVVAAKHWLTYIDLLQDSATLDVDSIAEDIADAERDLNAKTDSKREALARARLSRARARLREARKQRRELRLALLLDEE